MKRVQLLSAIAVLCVSTTQIWAQTALAAWNMAGVTNGGSSPMPPTDSNANVTVLGLTRGSGITTPTGLAGDAWGGAGFFDGLAAASQNASTATDAGNYVTFSITAKPGFAESFSSIGAYNIRKSGTGPSTMQWQYSLDGTNFTDIGATVPTGGLSTSGGNNKTAISLSGITALQNVEASTTVTFRLLIWGATADAGTWYFNSNTAATAANRILTINGTVAPSVGLPLELLSFKGKQEDNANVLSWTTASEKDITAFELERGADGRTFNKIASLAPKGNDRTTQNEYTYTDHETKAVSYYRLKMYERNDKATYSDIIVLRNNAAEAAISLYPNPAEDQLTVKGLQGTYSYQVIDVQGNIVLSAEAKMMDSNTAAIGVSQLPAGNYFIRFESGMETHTLRFVKK